MKAGQALVSLAPVMAVASRVETMKLTAGIQIITASVFMELGLAATVIMCYA